MNSTFRRSLRSIVHAIGALAMLAMLAVLIGIVDLTERGWIAKGLVAILFIRELFHGAENVASRFSFRAGVDGVSGEFDATEGRKPE